MDMDNKLYRAFDFNLKPLNPDVTVCEYVWLGSQDMRSKTMVIPKKVTALEDFPNWNYDASSTQQQSLTSNDIVLKPVFKCPDPFRQKNIPNSFLVLCETVEMDLKTPAMNNHRWIANKIIETAKDQRPWFGYEQEYILLKHEGSSFTWPLGFPKGGYPQAQGPYYCSIGAKNSFGRVIPEYHLNACLAAGLTIAGVNAEVFPGQWEYQIGPVEGIGASDQLWMSRYILRRVCEDFDLEVTFEPKPVSGDWNGTGCHANFSSESTRNIGGYDKIVEQMELLSLKHKDHIKVYGANNHLRLSGVHETSSMEKFNYGIANRGCSVRIPAVTVTKRCGYFEDRRPAGNCDPYLVSGMIVDTFCLNGKYGDEVLASYERVVGKPKTTDAERHSST